MPTLATLALDANTPLLIPLGLVCTLIIILIGTTWRAAVKRQRTRAEDACEELRKALMRGSTVTLWHRPPAAPVPPGADDHYLHVRTTRGDMLITEEQLAVALDRGRKLLPPT